MADTETKEMTVKEKILKGREASGAGAELLPEVPATLENAMLALLDERARQMFEKGFDARHDDAHAKGELARAAAVYALQGVMNVEATYYLWPFAREELNPKDQVSNLTRAGALILAELERLDRAGASDYSPGEGTRALTAEVQS